MSKHDEDTVDFGARLRQIRRRRKLDQADLAELARAPTTSISHFERNRRKPNFDTLIRLAEGLGVSIDFLVGRTEYPYVYQEPPEPVPRLLTDEQVKDIEVWIEYLKLTGRYSEDWAPVVRDDEPE